MKLDSGWGVSVGPVDLDDCTYFPGDDLAKMRNRARNSPEKPKLKEQPEHPITLSVEVDSHS